MTSLLDLPFDQYSRHRIVQIVANHVRESQQRSRLEVLDVGGFPCLTPQFLPEDRVVVIDLVAGETDGLATYVQADGTALPFRDRNFDLVVSLDSLEHVPGERRSAYLEELLRVSRGFVLLVAPFAQETTILAERLLAEFIRVVNQEEQPQLQEHRQYGLPDLEMWLSYLRNRGLAFTSFDSGYVYNWLPMMLVKHYVLSLPEAGALHRAIDHFYNATLEASDRRLPGYRRGVLISLVGPSPVLDATATALAPTGEADRLEVIERIEQISLLLQLADMQVASRKDDRLREDVIAKERHILNLESALHESQRVLNEAQRAAEEQMSAERAHTQALSARVQELEAHLVAIGNGRVMRALTALNRLRGRAS